MVLPYGHQLPVLILQQRSKHPDGLDRCFTTQQNGMRAFQPRVAFTHALAINSVRRPGAAAAPAAIHMPAGEHATAAVRRTQLGVWLCGHLACFWLCFQLWDVAHVAVLLCEVALRGDV
jgi:hypothetical protein